MTNKCSCNDYLTDILPFLSFICHQTCHPQVIPEKMVAYTWKDDINIFFSNQHYIKYHVKRNSFKKQTITAVFDNPQKFFSFKAIFNKVSVSLCPKITLLYK